MIQVRFDSEAEGRLVLVVEPPMPRAAAADEVAAADTLFMVLARKPDPGVSRSQLR